MATEVDARNRKLREIIRRLTALLDESRTLVSECEALLGGQPGVGDAIVTLEKSFEELWSAKYGTSYVWSRARDRASIKRLLRSLSAEDVGERMVRYIQSTEGFYAKALHSFPVFCASINAHARPIHRDDISDTTRRLEKLMTGK